MKYTVVITAELPPIARELLEPDFDVVQHPTEHDRTEDDVITILDDADAAITLLSDPLSGHVLESLPHLRIVSNYAVGYDNVDVEAARRLGIRVTNTPGVLTEATADLTMALILALQKVNGDLSDNQSKLKAALASIEIDAPNGKIKLDSNRQAIGTNFVTEVVDDGKGALFSKVVKVIPNVNQTLGYDPAVFAKIGLPSRTVPECKKY